MPRKKELEAQAVPDPTGDATFYVIPFECAEIKTEPLDEVAEMVEEQDRLFPRLNRRNVTSVAVQTAKRRIMSRSVQVDLQLVPKEALVNVQSGNVVDEPLGPDLTKGAAEKQCRICLRLLPEASLSYILFPQKTKILTALGVKVYLGDSYPFICRNCCAMVDLMYDFRNTSIRARNMLVHERKSIQSNGWDSVDNLGVIERCKLLVESHKRDIDVAYEASSFHKQVPPAQEVEVKVKPEAIELVMVDQIAVPAPVKEKSIHEEDDSSNNSHTIALKVEMDLNTWEGGDSSEEDSESDRLEEDGDSNSEAASADEDFAPSPPPVPNPPKKKRIRIVTKPYRKRQKREKNPSPDDQVALQDAEAKAKKKRKNAADPNRKRGALCDFCGDWVEYHTVESHKNQHLGIKPYACQTEGCKLSFSCRNLLVKHIKRQHGAEGPEYHDCEVCGQRIKGPKAALKKHQKTHTEEKNYICAVCGKGFTTPGYLRQHSIIHTDLMPYECSVCQRKFNNKYNMLTHEKKHYMRGETSGGIFSAGDGEPDADVANVPNASNAPTTVAAPMALPPFGEYQHHQPQQQPQQLQLPPHHLPQLHPLMHPQ